MKARTIAIALMSTLAFALSAEEPAGPASIEFGPDVDIHFVRFDLPLSAADELVFGLVYHDTRIGRLIPYPGYLQAFAAEIGYRFYLWEGLHLEGTILPQYVRCTQAPSGEVAEGFALAVEARAGYRFDFVSWEVRWFLNLQWFAGCYLVNPKPASFTAVDGGSFYASPIPMFLFGFEL